MITEQQQEQASLHVLGLLSEAEAREFESLLRTHAALRELVAELRATTEALAAAVPQHQPSPELKQRILSRIETQAAPATILPFPVRAPAPGLPWLPWAMAAGFAVGLILALAQNRSTHEQLALAQTKAGFLATEVAKLRERDRLSQLRIALLGSLLENTPKTVAVSLWDDEKQNGVLVVENLAKLPADKDYQLWLIDPKQANPVDAGVFKVDAKGNVRFDFKAAQPVGRFDKIAVTIERKGGAPKPEGTMVLLGS